MKHITLLMIGFLTTAFTVAQTPENELPLIPQPVSVRLQSGRFILPEEIVIQAPQQTEINRVTTYLKNKLVQATGYRVLIKDRVNKAVITCVVNKNHQDELGTEGYSLQITALGIVIRANQAAGLFYGVQTLIQLLPKEIESAAVVRHKKWTLPLVAITDYPRFGWRGIMLDVSRHFFTKQEIKQYIDQLVRYKFNLLHLHLTDDQGWRIDIKSLPRLTTVGANPVQRMGGGKFIPPSPREPRSDGEYYTQTDIEELVQYGKDRFLNIMPEMDMPGHSFAAIVAYPDLSCATDSVKERLRSGGQVMNFTQIGNTLDPSSEQTYAFVDKVVTEVAQLSPFPYMHLGGDECVKSFWAKSDSVKALMKKEGLTTMDQVQGYFEKRVEQIVQSKGKKFMGWDEILEGGLGPNAAVMSWRGIQGGITATKLGHPVVMSPTTFAYLDYMQGDPAVEPPLFASLRLNKAYMFEPAPDSVDARFILGGQANLWTEQIATFRQVEYMSWPRGFAIAESVWSAKGTKNWDKFYPRVEAHFARLREGEIKYAPSMYDPDFTVSMGADSLIRVRLTTELPDLTIYYSVDNSYPDQFSPTYTEPLVIPKEATQLRVITYRGQNPLGRMITMPIAELKSRLDKETKKQ